MYWNLTYTSLYYVIFEGKKWQYIALTDLVAI